MWLLTLHYGRIVLRNLRETTVATSFVENQQHPGPSNQHNTLTKKASFLPNKIYHHPIRPYKIQSTNKQPETKKT